MSSGVSKRRVKIFASFAALIAAPALRADVVVGDAAVTYPVVSATSALITMKTGCDSGVPITIPWGQVRSIIFDGECREHEITRPTAGLLPCSQARLPAFKIYPTGDQSAIYATGFQLQDKLVRIALPDNQGSLSGPQQNVSALARVQACPTELSPPAAHPSSFCFEPVQFAVNWSLDPSMPNTVFTRGFAVFVQTLPEHVTAPALDIRGALGTALTVWTSGLLKYKDKLGPTVASYLQTTVSRSSSFVLLTPPQVIQVVCKENASLIVRVSAARGGDFPKADSDYLAKSQIEGRTMLLNEVDHKFEYTLTRKVNPGDYDLIWVLAHELGHSFGLPDEYLGPDQPSIMNPDTRPLEITEQDALALGKSLEQSIRGTTPGYFNATQCGGLRVSRATGSAEEESEIAVRDSGRQLKSFPFAPPRVTSPSKVASSTKIFRNVVRDHRPLRPRANFAEGLAEASKPKPRPPTHRAPIPQCVSTRN